MAVEWSAPRLVVPGVCGIVALAGAGFYFLTRAPEPLTIIGFAVATALLLMEAVWRARFAAGIAGTAVLIYVFCGVIGRALGIWKVVVFPAAILPGVFLTLAAVKTRESRRAKRSNL